MIAPFPFNDQPPELLVQQQILTCQEQERFGTLDPSCFSLAWCVFADKKEMRLRIESFRLFSSTHLIQFNYRQRALCMRKRFQCCVRTLQARFQPCTFDQRAGTDSSDSMLYGWEDTPDYSRQIQEMRFGRSDCGFKKRQRNRKQTV